jgi:4-amino-4-deoxy-L-arabinose transferase-like glycosyltransferase
LITFVGGSLFILFFNLWGRTLENHDYLRYAEVAKEMIQSGDWVVPRFNGEIYLHKPPLLFWLIALPSEIYGSVTPFLARLPSAFFAWIGGIVVYLWGRKIWGNSRSGLISSGVLLSSYIYFRQGRIARTDMVFSVLILLSLYFFYLRYQRGSVYLTGISFVFMGMAGITKGPVGLLLPFSVMTLFFLTRRQLRLLVRRDFLLGHFVMTLVLGSWLVPFLSHVGWDKALEVWQETKILTRRAPFYLYGYRIWIDFAPWSILLPSLLFYYWGKEKTRDEKFLILWFFGLFSLLTLFPNRASKYLLSAFPALALLMGGFWRNRSTTLFWVLFLCAITVWHGYEFYLVRGNEKRSRGILIEKELRPFRRDIVFAYRMDIDILGKINFYGDTLIPQVNRIKDLKREIGGGKEILILTPQRVTEDLIQEGFHITPLKIIEHKDTIFILCKLR